MLNEAQADAAVRRTLRTILEEGGPPPAREPTAGDRLDALGLKSLDLARLVAELEEELDFNPFAELVDITSVRTVGDLVAAYSAKPQP